MGETLSVVLLVGAAAALAASTGPVCQDDWTTYKDELCIKTFNTFETYEGAREFCFVQGNQASLVTVKESELQQLLANYTQGIFDNIWLGGKYDTQSNQFRWNDGEPLTFTNWQDGYPRIIDNSDSCIELRPSDGKNVATGKWADVTCQKRNLVMCQKTLEWSFQDAVSEIIKLRKQLKDANEKIEEVSSKVIPVGSTYVEYSNQPNPATLWPSLTWEDVTNEYEGLFFRAYGGGSAEEWGVTQSECAPRITQMEWMFAYDVDDFPGNISIPATGWSSLGLSGFYYVPDGTVADDYRSEGLKYHTEGCEVRPKNQAIRIWKRVG